MAVRGMKLIPGILKIKDQMVRTVKMGEEILGHPTNPDLVQIYVEDGFGSGHKTRVMRKNPDRYKNINKSHVVRIPNDFIGENIEISTTPAAICTVAHMCKQKDTREIEKLNKQIVKLEKSREYIKSRLETKIKSLESKYDDIISNQAMRK